jgi:glutaconate CoA-transferase subunit A
MGTRRDKRCSLAEAVQLLPEDGCRLALGGITLYRRPIAFALALIERFRRSQSPRHISLLSFTAGLESDILLGEGMVDQVRTCYFGLEVFGLAPHFTRLAGEGKIEIVEESEASLAYGIRATLAGVGFMPSHAWQGTDLLRIREDVKSIRDPYSGEMLTAFPAIDCDVAVIHALEADREGNAHIGKHWGVDRELALVADSVIVTAEQVVDELSQAEIVAPVVEAVVEAPRGAWPTSCHPLYPLDGMAALAYTQSVGSAGYGELLKGWADEHGLDFRP